jgi:hypothetical protein
VKTGKAWCCVVALITQRRLEKNSKVLDSTMDNSGEAMSMSGGNGKRKRRVCRQDNEEMPSEPVRKLRRMLQSADVSSRRSVATLRPQCGSTAREERAEITEGRGCLLEPEGHADDEHRSVDVSDPVAEHPSVDNSTDEPRNLDEGEQVGEHPSVDNSSDGDSVKCPICSATFTTQDVATPNTCNHPFCAACLEELSQNENNCPNTMVIPVQPPKQQGEPQCCEYILGHDWNPVISLSSLLALMAIYQVLFAYLLRKSSML